MITNCSRKRPVDSYNNNIFCWLLLDCSFIRGLITLTAPISTVPGGGPAGTPMLKSV